MIIKTRGQKKSWKPPSRGLGGHCRGSSSYGHGSVTLAHSEHVGCANQVLRHHWPRSNLWLVATHTHTCTHTHKVLFYSGRDTPLVIHFGCSAWAHLFKCTSNIFLGSISIAISKAGVSGQAKDLLPSFSFFFLAAKQLPLHFCNSTENHL